MEKKDCRVVFSDLKDLVDEVGLTYDKSWEEAPDWAKWKAQSADGTWEWFSTKPRAHDFGLYVKGTFMPSGKGKSEIIKSGDGNRYFTRPNPEWRKTVSKRPLSKLKDNK